MIFVRRVASTLSTVLASPAIHVPSSQPMRTVLPDDPDIRLLVPIADVADPVVSIVVPSLNEELTIVDFVSWCHAGLAAAGVRGEIVIVDSSGDDTPNLAVAAGARVLQVPKRGLGRAYIDALPHVRGQFVIMGDADCTYDFRLLAPFVEAWRQGFEFVMGSRWQGSIEKGSMPPHHQYFGTPLTTWILNRVYSSKFSDIHCGMRGLTTDAFRRMQLSSQSWEYASEMVLKSVHLELRTTEVPVVFLKDRDGRVSHHRRMGWFSPFQAAWINLRAMFVYGADFFTFRPGVVLALFGLIILLPVSLGPVDLGPITLSLYWQFFGVVLAIVGTTAVLLGGFAQMLFDYTGRYTRRWLRCLRYTRAAILSAGTSIVGLACFAPLVRQYLANDLRLTSPLTWRNHLAVTGMYLIYLGFVMFVGSLLVHAIALATGRHDE